MPWFRAMLYFWDLCCPKQDISCVPSKTFLVFQAGHGSKIARMAPILTIFWRKWSQRPKFFFRKFSRRRNFRVVEKFARRASLGECFEIWWVPPLRTYVRTYVRNGGTHQISKHSPNDARRANFSTTRKFRRRENFRKKNLGRCDHFRQKIVKIGAILAIFEPCPAWNTRNVLLGTQEMSCLGQHRSQKYNIARNHGIMGLKKSSSKNDEF